MSEEEKKEEGFQVKDRRRFTEDGESKPQAEPPPQAPSEPQSAPDQTTASSDSEQAPAEKKESDERSSTPLPEINFSTFVVSLSSSALIHLGIAPDPVSGETMCEPAYAKQTIDILAMLKEKTKGNLSKEEDQMLEGLLYDLRMRYISEIEKKGK